MLGDLIFNFSAAASNNRQAQEERGLFVCSSLLSSQLHQDLGFVFEILRATIHLRGPSLPG